MKVSRRPRLARTLLASATGLALAVTMSVPTSAASLNISSAKINSTPGNDSQALGGAAPLRLKNLKVSGPLSAAKGEVSVFVQFSGDGAFEQTQSATAMSGLAAPKKDPTRVKKIRDGIKAQGNSAAKQAKADVIYNTTNTLPGVALRGDADALRALASRADVVKISAIVPKKLTNKGSVVDTKALDSWTALKQTGVGVTIAVLDTGLDYTHADFGGPGTVAAFKKAQASKELPSKASGLFDSTKFAGGWDLVGDDYDADPTSATYQPIPHPDSNPLDCQGHGSHVAGTAAGFGVNAKGKTFRGQYGSLTAAQVHAMRIGPGSAPEARLVSLRVFGCNGSSDVVGQALDRVLDPNNDGNFDDRAQIVNMSLGSDQSPADDPENAIVDALTRQGVLSVVASGNAADITDIGGSPGNSRSSLTVANSVGSHITLDGINVLAPADQAGVKGGQYSANFDYTNATQAQLTGNVVMGPQNNAFGCQPFAAGSLQGKWVWLQWSQDGAFPCGSATRFNNAQAAGATGVLLDSEVNVFDAGIAGNATIPGAQLTLANSNALRPAAAAGTLQVQLSPSLIGSAFTESGALDTLNPSSSRGVHGSEGIVKPDVAAMGTLISSVGVGTGNGPAVMTGTSMATPLTAGIAALVAGSGKYTPYQVKSIVMNTAVADVRAPNGSVYGPARVGSGRVIASNAVSTPAYAFATDAPDLTSVVFGVIEVGKKKYTSTKSITVVNKSKKTQTYKVSYLPATTIPGASYTLDSRSVTVLPGGKAKVKVTLRVDPKKFAKTLDPTMDREQLGVPRAWVSDISGRVQFASSSAPTLRVPVHGAPKLVSNMRATAKATTGKKSDSAEVKLSGRDILQGTGDQQVVSLISAFELGATSKRQPRSIDTIAGAREMDLQYVGASSDARSAGAADGMLNFGVSTWGNWAHLAGGTEIDVDIDVDNDGQSDFVVFTTTVDGLDLDVVATYDLRSGDQVDLQFTNGLAGDIDANTFDTNVVGLPVSLAALGLTGTSAPIRYRVSTYSSYNLDDTGAYVPVDETGWIKYNALNPNLWFEGNGTGTVFTDLNRQKLTAHPKAGVKEAKALYLHLHNATGDLSGKRGSDGDRAQLGTIRVKPAKGHGHK
ncbi:S8 family serine peptidase [Paeniglutamicibacter cryotolerans]|uniref:Subtilisin family serine protease n=1 Tax=Paeniglutamicibacter cryotolerans TaxID=670079 RepID=A0A839QTA0_9MICC|nr:S8 family serine peptidase [Paeniglutamicibacter cryotolerans]MBB2995261.1 subtilisin family serine protease [Paeniglutamicibacter cryotolerans]